MYVFPFKEYGETNIGTSNVLKFARMYHGYILYSNKVEEGTRKYRARTFVLIDHEMDIFYESISKCLELAKWIVRIYKGYFREMTQPLTSVVERHKTIKDLDSMKSSLFLVVSMFLTTLSHVTFGVWSTNFSWKRLI